MINPTPSICINVDVTNPGQFFACCGLLELADRLWPGAEGWFENKQFMVDCKGDLKELLSIMIMDQPNEITIIEANGLIVKPIIAPLIFTFNGGSTTDLLLDSWMKIQILKGQGPSAIANTPWNFWSGQQTSFGIWTNLRIELSTQLNNLKPDDLKDLFNQCVFQKGRFGFDPGPAWNPLDVGFSPNEQGIEVQSSAAVELLAAIGLQRFRPIVLQNRESFEYLIWNHPLPPLVAASAISGALADNSSVRYRSCIVSRGQYSALGFSFPIY